MIGLLAHPDDWPAAAEFFQLFKTPWEHYQAGRPYDVLVVCTGELPDPGAARLMVVYNSADLPWHSRFGLELKPVTDGSFTVLGEDLPIYGRAGLLRHPGSPDSLLAVTACGSATLARAGYDLFTEVRRLISEGQPATRALAPALDRHIQILRYLILQSGVTLVEIPPAPAGHKFIACLTHDIDFVSLRQHRFDHTMAGFLYRATLGSLLDFCAGRKSLSKLARNWAAVLQVPCVHLRLCRDFWMQFQDYLEVENGRPSTFFIIPFKNRPGVALRPGSHSRRATAYDISDVAEWAPVFRQHGCELALHGIDAWHDPASARTEADRIAEFAQEKPAGLRMHWLYFNEASPAALDQAGFDYDSTSGYNEAVGYRAGTGQVFQPPGCHRLLELPMHIQDTALFYPGRMHLKESAAWDLCLQLIGHAEKNGGVLTLLWHDRSLAPERLWGDFYARLLERLETGGVWFATAEQTVRWFRKRRSLEFQELTASGNALELKLRNSSESSPDLAVRCSWLDTDGIIHQTDTPVAGRNRLRLEVPVRPLAEHVRPPVRPRPDSETAALAV